MSCGETRKAPTDFIMHALNVFKFRNLITSLFTRTVTNENRH